jgi:hypothetical protein
MKHELKIIIKCESEDIDDNGSHPNNITIYLDDEPIGVVQQFKLEADCKKISPTIEFTFLNFDDPNIDPVYFKGSHYMYTYTKEYIDRLSMINGIKIYLQNLFNEKIKEIGTDGIIDKIKMDK